MAATTKPPTLRRLLWRELALIAAIFAPLLVAVSWIGYAQVIGGQSRMLSRQAASSLQGRIDDRLDRVHRGAMLLASLWREGVVDPAQATEARAHLLPLLRSLPGKGNILLVRSPDGVATVGVRDPPNLAIEGLQPLPDGTTRFSETVYHRERDDVPPLGSRVWATPYRALERPWVAQVKAAGAPTWTEPYEFANFLSSGHGARRVGITFGTPVWRDGALLGYVGVDLLLSDLDELAGAVRPTPASEVTILDDKDRLLGASAAKGSMPRGSWHSESLRLSSTPGHPWRVTLSIPDSELSGPTRRQLALFALAVILLFVLAILRMRTVGKRVVHSLQELAAAADRVGLDAPKSIDVPALELARVRDALAQSHGGVLLRRQLEHQLQHSQRVGLVGFLAGGLAHDLNNQLAVLISGLSEARAVAGSTGQGAALLTEAEQAAWRCVEMTRGMLKLSRRGAPTLRSVDLASVIEGAAGLVRRVMDKSVEVKLALVPGLPLVEADPVQLEQVLLNLALNARDAMPSGGVLSFETRAVEGGVELVVRDTGTGITPEVRARLFEPFFTTKEAGKGTGLGLAMVRSIVDQHGGQVDVESEPGRGTAFRVRLRAA